MHYIKRHLIILLLFVSAHLAAQQSYRIPANINHFAEGKICFNNKEYAAAINHYQTFLDDVIDDKNSNQHCVEAQYYVILSNYYLEKEGIILEMIDFAKKNEGTYWCVQLRFNIANYYFNTESYRNALKYYTLCPEKDLSKEQLPIYYYQTAYSLYFNKKLVESKPYFKLTLDLKSEYYYEALYYYSFLQYKEKNYNSALDGFKQLLDQDKFESTAPYFIAQIYFLKEDYKALVDLVPELFSDKYTENDLELNRIVGDAYYNMKEYDKAITYLEAYQNKSKKILRQDLYHLGIAYYMKKDYAKASETLALISAQNDPLSQSAYSYLGECFVRLGNKKRACLAYATAAKYKFDPSLREDAYFNYIKLSYETSISPFNGTIASLEGFLKEFPESDYAFEVYNLMYQSFITTSNYKDAYGAIERLKDKDPRLGMAYQRITYYCGVELYNEGKYKESANFFNKSLSGDILEKNLKAKALYWLADSYFQMENYDNALKNFELFINTPGVYTIDEFAIAHYNMGYSLFKMHRYYDAISWFRKFTQLDNAINNNWMTDAYNRSGDCYYLKRDFFNAIKYYTLAIEEKGEGADYAYYQKGFCQGMNKQYNPKIATLNHFLKIHPESSYADDALHEVADTWIILDQYEEAIKCYLQLPLSYPNSKFASSSLLSAALAYYNNKEYEKALDTYKKVIEKYPNSQEARSALAALKSISIEQNSVEDYIIYAKEKGVDDTLEQDSLTFTAAEKLYIDQQFKNSIKAFKSYTQKFPNGEFILIAYFYMADAHMQISQDNEAIACLEYIAEQPRNMYTEQSLSVLSTTYFDNKDYSKALITYKKLLENAEQKANILAAKIGVMECNYLLGEAGATILAIKDLSKENISSSLLNTALYYKAKSYLKLNNKDAAIISFAELAQQHNTPYSAEAKYLLAEMQFNDGDTIGAKQGVLDFINHGSSQQYWLAKSFILLSDIYLAEGDLFQAKQYLLSIIDNYNQADDILTIVTDKLTIINKKEEAENQTKRDSLGSYFIDPTNSVN